MNKAVHALVFVILVLAGCALFYEYNLFQKRALLGDRNRQLEDYLVKVAHTIEKADAQRPAQQPEILKDNSPVEAKEVDSPEMVNELEDYPSQLEEQNLETLDWDSPANNPLRLQLRQYLLVGPDGLPRPDPVNPGGYVHTGPGTADDLLSQLFDRAKSQLAKLNTTRAELVQMRQRLDEMTGAYNKLKPEMRGDKVHIEELKTKISELEQDKVNLEGKIEKQKSQIDDLNTDLASAKEEAQAAKDELEVAKEKTEKANKKADQLQKMLQQRAQTQSVASAGTANVAPLTQGDKGKIVRVDNELDTVIIDFDPAALKELLGEELQNPLPMIEMAVHKPNGKEPGVFVGRVRLRKYVAGKHYVIATILDDWQQADIKNGDVVYAE